MPIGRIALFLLFFTLVWLAVGLLVTNGPGQQSLAAAEPSIPPLFTRAAIPSLTPHYVERVTVPSSPTPVLVPPNAPNSPAVFPTETSLFKNETGELPLAQNEHPTPSPAGMLAEMPVELPIEGAAAVAPPQLKMPQGTISWTLKVPILMYHYISTPPADADNYRVDLSVEPAAFHAQMQYLHDNGYTPIDFYTLALAITENGALPDKPVILTFDDGYVDNYYNAFPILEAFDFVGTFFIVTEFVDFGYAPYMTWPMIEQMASAGQRIEPHSKTHMDMRGRDRDFLVYEILGSLQTIEAHIGYTPRFFSYPGGAFDDDVIAILNQANFWGAVTTISGKWHGFNDRYEWKRLRIRHSTTLPVFADIIDPVDTVGGKRP